MLKITFRTLLSRTQNSHNIGARMPTNSLLTIGTRASPLAMAQTEEAAARLSEAHGSLSAPDAIRIVKIESTGDKIQDRHLAEIGGKGLFAKELDAALIDKRIDIAVHSLKDLETRLPDGIVLAACLEREDPRDALIGPGLSGLEDIPKGGTVGTASLRRQSQLLYHRPDLNITLLRGNIQTRLRKIRENEVDASFLAFAGLKRMGLEDKAACILSTNVMIPACGQGAIGITCRQNDTIAWQLLKAVNHVETMLRITAERAMLDVLDGTCRTPIGGLAELIRKDELVLRGLIATPTGSAVFTGTEQGLAADADAVGRELGARLRCEAGQNLFLKQ